MGRVRTQAIRRKYGKAYALTRSFSLLGQTDIRWRQFDFQANTAGDVDVDQLMIDDSPTTMVNSGWMRVSGGRADYQGISKRLVTPTANDWYKVSLEYR